jgi:hypothetical protein
MDEAAPLEKVHPLSALLTAIPLPKIITSASFSVDKVLWAKPRFHPAFPEPHSDALSPSTLKSEYGMSGGWHLNRIPTICAKHPAAA